MTLARIVPTETGDLYVAANGSCYRRRKGKWQMRGNSGKWFGCDIHDPIVRNQVADYENCLRSYSIDEVPDYPTGRRRNETIGDFIRRKQSQELAAATKNIFAKVPTKYSASAENAKRLAAHLRHIHYAPFDSSRLTK